MLVYIGRMRRQIIHIFNYIPFATRNTRSTLNFYCLLQIVLTSTMGIFKLGVTKRLLKCHFICFARIGFKVQFFYQETFYNQQQQKTPVILSHSTTTFQTFSQEVVATKHKKDCEFISHLIFWDISEMILFNWDLFSKK